MVKKGGKNLGANYLSIYQNRKLRFYLECNSKQVMAVLRDQNIIKKPKRPNLIQTQTGVHWSNKQNLFDPFIIVLKKLGASYSNGFGSSTTKKNT